MVVLGRMFVVGESGGIGLGAVEGVGQGARGLHVWMLSAIIQLAVGGIVCRRRGWRGRIMWRATGKVDWSRAYCDTILAVVDATAVGENVDVGTLGAKLAVALVETSQ